MAEGGVRDRASEAMTRAKRRMGLENPSAAEEGGNVGIVRGGLRALGDGQLDQFVDILKPDVTWEAPSGNFPGGEALDGRDEVKDKFLGICGRTFSEFGFVPEKFLDADDENAVVVFGTFVGEGVEGDSLNEPSVLVFQFEGNEADHVRVYTDSAAWPEPMTEEREKKLEEKEKEKEKEEEEKRKQEEAESESSDDSEGKGDSENENDDEQRSESRNRDEAEANSDSGGGESRSESDERSGASSS